MKCFLFCFDPDWAAFQVSEEEKDIKLKKPNSHIIKGGSHHYPLL